ncbi:DNA glycosylase [Lyophyllum atratum]|nr:DNA glycosylase [Lyophyllum atratum]
MPPTPHTPKRTKIGNRAATHSPYFSGAASALIPTITCQSDTDFDELSDSDDNHSDLLYDPLFRYYFRAFLVLYRQLALLKPVLIQVTLLNKTSGRLAIPIFWVIVNKWPTPWALSQADSAELTAIIGSLGTQNVRSRRLIDLSKTYIRDPPRAPDLRPSTPRVLPTDPIISSPSKRQRYPPTPVSHLPGAGQYALDSYRIFCTGDNPSTTEEWKTVMPTDKELIRYLVSMLSRHTACSSNDG